MSEPTEVLHLTHELTCDGLFWKKEVVFGSDHLVFSRTSWLSDPKEGYDSHGWMPVVQPDGQPAKWQDIEALRQMASRMEVKGWQVEWHPEHGEMSRKFFVGVVEGEPVTLVEITNKWWFDWLVLFVGAPAVYWAFRFRCYVEIISRMGRRGNRKRHS